MHINTRDIRIMATLLYLTTVRFFLGFAQFCSRSFCALFCPCAVGILVSATHILAPLPVFFLVVLDYAHHVSRAFLILRRISIIIDSDSDIVIMPPKIQIWTKEKENLLILEVERRPILWHITCDAYRRTDLKYSQWREIAKILGPSFNAEMVQNRFTCMKQTFMANYRKERESKQRCSGKSPDEIYKPKWILYDRLQFLKKSCAQATSQSNLQSPSYSTESDCTESLDSNVPESIEYLECDATDIAQCNLSDTQQSYAISVEHNNSDEITSCTTKHSLITSNINAFPNMEATANKENLYVKRGANKRKKGTIMEEALGAIKTLTNQPIPQTDSMEFLGNFISARLREMSPSSRKSCEHDILQCLANY